MSPLRRAWWRIGDLAGAVLVGGPVRAVVAGLALFYAIGHFVGWWAVVAIAAAGLADLVWCASRLPARWRWW